MRRISESLEAIQTRRSTERDDTVQNNHGPMSYLRVKK